MVVLTLSALGGMVGMTIAAVAASYGADRRFWPWPRARVCGYGASSRARCAYARALIDPYARRGPALMRLLSVGVVTATTFDGLGLQYATAPTLLLISVVEATLLLLLLVIDLEVRLVPTPIVGLLVVVALASANLWPGLGLRDAMIGGAIGFASFAALGGLARLLYGADAFGLGDAMLALAIGCIIGYPLVVATLALAWIIHENIHRIGLVADGGLAGSQSPLWAPKSALRPLQPVYRGGLFSQMRSI